MESLENRKLLSLFIAGCLFAALTNLHAQSSGEEAQYRFAQQLYSDGLYSAAAEQFKQFVANYPESERALEAYFLIADSFLLTEDFSDAVESFRKYISFYPNSPQTPEAWWKLGRSLEGAGMLPDAIRAYRTLVSRFGESAFAARSLLSMGNFYFKLSDWDEAIRIYETLINNKAVSPEAIEAKFKIGKTYVMKGETERGLLTFSELVQSYPEHPIAMNTNFEIGLLMLQESDFDSAKVIFSTLLTRYPNSPMVDKFLLGLGDCYVGIGDYEQALSIYNKLMSEFPGSEVYARSLFKTAQIMVETEDFSNAVDKFHQLLGLEAVDEELRTDTIFQKAEAEIRIDRPEDAVKTLQEIVDGNGDPGTVGKAVLKTASVYKEMGKYNEALNILERRWSNDESNDQIPELLFSMGEVYELGTKNYIAAVNTYSKLIADHPSTSEAEIAQFAIGRSYESAGQIANAVNAYRAYEKQYPLGQLYDDVVARRKYLESFELKDYKSAVAELFDIYVNDDKVEIDLRLGEIAADKLKDYGRAIESFERYIGKGNSDKIPYAFYRIGAALLLLSERARYESNFEEAEAKKAEANIQFEKIISVYPTSKWDVDARFQLLQLRYTEVDTMSGDGMMQLLVDCLEFVGKNPKREESGEILFIVGDLEERLPDSGKEGFRDKAEASYLRAAESYPENPVIPEVLLKLAQLQEKRGEVELARQNYISIIERYAGSAHALKAQSALADIYYELGDFKEARRLYTDFVEKFPHDPSVEILRIKIAETFYYEGDFADAARQYERIFDKISLLKEGGEIYYTIADAYYHTGRYNDGLKCLKLLSRHFPEERKAGSRILLEGNMLTKLGAVEKARNTFELLVKSPYKTEFAFEGYTRIADLLLEAGDYAGAERNYKKALGEKKAKHDKSIAARIEAQITKSDFRAGDIKSALKKTDKFQKYYPDETELITSLKFEEAEYYRKKQKGEQADSLYRYILINYPGSVHEDAAAFGIGTILFVDHDYNEALSAFQDFTESFPGSPLIMDAKLKVGNCYFLTRRFDKSKEIYKDLLLEDTERRFRKETLFNLGLSCQKLSQWEETIDAFKKYAEEFPYDPDAERALLNVGFGFEQWGKLHEALELFLSLRPMDPDVAAENQYWIGESYFNLGEYEKAIVELLKVTFLYPEQELWGVTAEYKAGMAYEVLGKYTEAVRVYNKIIDFHVSQPDWVNAAKERLEQISSNKRKG